MADLDPAPLPAPDSGRSGLRVAAALVLLSVLLCALRHPDLPTAGFMEETLSLHRLAPQARAQALSLLLLPLGSLLVVFTRLTLGLRMLGPFRPVLIAVALQLTGVPVGLAFLVTVFGFTLALRPRLRSGRWLPYFARLSVMLSSVVGLAIGALVVGNSAGWEPLARAAFFPIVVLCLAADGFAEVVARAGRSPALFRTGVTLAIALAVNLVATIPGVRWALLQLPELLLLEIAAMLVIAVRLRLGLLAGLNPEPRAVAEPEPDSRSAALTSPPSGGPGDQLVRSPGSSP